MPFAPNIVLIVHIRPLLTYSSILLILLIMDIYHIWANKEDDISDTDWYYNLKSFLDHLISENKMISYRITRCKMGFRSIANLPEWHIMMEFTDMAQMEQAFKRVAPLKGELETKHKSFNQFVSDDIQHALYRDWPDEIR
jgi:hypothetical protein